MIDNYHLFEQVGRLLIESKWIFAKTMPENPHEYTLRKTWKCDEYFVKVVNYIRQHGYKTYFNKRPYIQLNVNDHFYWTMGAPIDQTILINRKINHYESTYDSVADIYDELFDNAESQVENEEIFAKIGNTSYLNVLDIGCGTGLFLDFQCPARYTGIDTSRRMLDRLQAKHPAATVLNTPLHSFVGSRYDLIVALFGSASYLTDEELNRIPSLLNPGGRSFLMFYKPGYSPLTHRIGGISPDYRFYTSKENGGYEFNHFVIVDKSL